MSAVRAPKSPEPGRRPDAGGKTPEELRIEDLVQRREEIKGHYRISPVQKMQADLAQRLHQPKTISFGAMVATLLVLCLSMSVATFVLLSSA